MQLAQSYLQGMGSPFDGVLEAYGQGQQFRENRGILEAREAEQARKIQAQQQLEELDWSDMGAVRRVVAQFPEYTKGAKDYYDALEAKEQQSLLLDMSKSISALGSERPDIAVQSMREKAAAYEDMGLPEKAEEYSQMAEWMATDPQTARKHLLMNYSLLAGKDAGAAYDSFSGAGIAEEAAPVDRAKTQAEADRLTTLTPLEGNKLVAEEADTYAGAKQKIAAAGKLVEETTDISEMRPYNQAESESKSSLNTANSTLATTRATDIPIARADAQAQQAVANELAQLKIQLQSEGNQVQRDRLGVQIKNLEFKKAQYEAGLTTKQIATNLTNQKRLAAYDKNIGSIEQTRSTITRLLNNKHGLDYATGPLASRLPSANSSVIQFEKDIETLQSQVFLTQVEKMRGLGALTDFEGKKLETGIANLSLRQSKEDLAKNLQIIYDAMAGFEKAAKTEYKDLLGEVSQNQTGSTAGRSYMQYAN